MRRAVVTPKDAELVFNDGKQCVVYCVGVQQTLKNAMPASKTAKPACGNATVAFADHLSVCVRYGPDCVLSPVINNLPSMSKRVGRSHGGEGGWLSPVCVLRALQREQQGPKR